METLNSAGLLIYCCCSKIWSLVVIGLMPVNLTEEYCRAKFIMLLTRTRTEESLALILLVMPKMCRITLIMVLQEKLLDLYLKPFRLATWLWHLFPVRLWCLFPVSSVYGCFDNRENEISRKLYSLFWMNIGSWRSGWIGPGILEIGLWHCA